MGCTNRSRTAPGLSKIDVIGFRLGSLVMAYSTSLRPPALVVGHGGPALGVGHGGPALMVGHGGLALMVGHCRLRGPGPAPCRWTRPGQARQ